MKKFAVVALASAFLLAVLWPAAASARHTLAHRVSVLEAKMNCLKRTAMSTYLGYAWYEEDGSVHVLTDTTNFSDSAASANFQQAFGDTSAPDYWIVAVRNTSTCRPKFGIIANPYASASAAWATQTLKLHRLARVW